MCKSKGEGGHGFEDPHAFNLLCLDLRILIHQQSSLASQIFKGRYYPNMDFLLAPVKSVIKVLSPIPVGMDWSVTVAKLISMEGESRGTWKL